MKDLDLPSSNDSHVFLNSVFSFSSRSPLYNSSKLDQDSYSIAFIVRSISREDYVRYLIHKKKIRKGYKKQTCVNFILFKCLWRDIFKFLKSKNIPIFGSDSIKIKSCILYDIIAELYTIQLFLVIQEEYWTAHPEEIDARYQSRPMTSLGCYPIMIFFLSFPTRNLSLGQTSNRNFIPRWLLLFNFNSSNNNWIKLKKKN